MTANTVHVVVQALRHSDYAALGREHTWRPRPSSRSLLRFMAVKSMMGSPGGPDSKESACNADHEQSMMVSSHLILNVNNAIKSYIRTVKMTKKLCCVDFTTIFLS